MKKPNTFFTKKEKGKPAIRVFSDGSWYEAANGIRRGRSNTLRNWYREQKLASQK